MRISSGDSLINNIPLKQSRENMPSANSGKGGTARAATAPSSMRRNVEAMVLAQISKSVIDKAIAISSRLRSMAGRALATGEIDNEAVRTELSRMQGTVSQYGEKIFIPGPQGVENQKQFTENAQKVQEIGDKMLAGNHSKDNVLELDNVLGDFTKLRGPDSQKDAKVAMKPGEAEKFVAGITAGIVSDSKSFMEVQGNLNKLSAKLATN